jgi:peptidyl-dipeptidase Dcp
MSPDNPFGRPSGLPYQLPPFDRIGVADYEPAFIAGMADQRGEFDAIAHNAATPTFDNTIVALERSGRLLDRVATVFFNLNSSDGDEAMLAIETSVAPLLSAHDDEMHLDAALFARIDALYQQRARMALDPESLQLLLRYHSQFVRAGAQLADAEKSQLRDLNRQLSTLTTRFRQNVLKSSHDAAVVVEHESELDGLSGAQKQAAADAARARGLDGKWLLALQNTTMQPFYQASIARAFGGASDNTAIIARVVRLRAQRARLLGFASHAAYVLCDETAGDPQSVQAMLRQIAGAALPGARARGLQLQQLIDREAAAAGRDSFTLQPWDWDYYSERLRQADYDFDLSQIRPFFELDRVLHDGLFHVAHALHGLTFHERRDLPLYQNSVRVFEVFDADGAPLALFLADYYARDNKQGGAWMNSFVTQSRLFGLKPVVANTLNIPPPAAGEPTLLTFDEVRTLFHEFGHALHGMLSDVQYPLLSGTNVPRDFVEYPSQYNEMWARQPEVLAHFARHYATGAPMPQALLAKVLAAQNFDQAYLTTEYLAAAAIDQSWHQIEAHQAPEADQVMAFEAAALEAQGLTCGAVPPRYHSPYFLHIFSGGYSAGYYAYLWSEVLARDTGAWLLRRGGMTRANGDTLRSKILSRGRTEDPQALFQKFYGGPPEIEPLLEYRGLTRLV